MQDIKIPSFACESYYIEKKVNEANKLGELFKKAYGKDSTFHQKRTEETESCR